MVGSPQPGENWGREEVELLLDAYFELMAAERSGAHPVKADINRGLQAALPARSRGSIEYKLQNLSAALNDLGLPWIDGYKPARNYQAILKTAASAWLTDHPRVAEQLAVYGDETPIVTPAATRLSDVVVPVPDSSSGRRSATLHLSRGDWGALRDARNRELGAAGESWVLALERAELVAGGRGDLAEAVEWVSKTRGDGLGYDVASFTADGEPTNIEVKTTNLGPRAPFYLTRRELAASDEDKHRFRLYRVFEFSRVPRVFILAGGLAEQVTLEPLLYHARV